MPESEFFLQLILRSDFGALQFYYDVPRVGFICILATQELIVLLKHEYLCLLPILKILSLYTFKYCYFSFHLVFIYVIHIQYLLNPPSILIYQIFLL